MRTGTIYCLQNIVTKKRYVGQTLDFDRRMGEYAKGYGHGVIGKSIAKHGWDKFAIKIVENIPENTLDEAEKFWIDFLNCQSPNGYNLSAGGESSPMKHPEVRDKNSATQKAMFARGEHPALSPEARAKRKATYKAMYERGEHPLQTPEARAKRTATHKAMYDRGEHPSQTPEARAKRIETMKAIGARGDNPMQNPDIVAKMLRAKRKNRGTIDWVDL